MTQRLVVVTGAGGFVGSEIALQLLAAGYDVIGIDLEFDGETSKRLAGVRRIEGELSSVLQNLPNLKPFAIVHGAAITASPEEFGVTPAAHISLNVNLLTECIAWARRQSTKWFVFLSSSGVFDASDSSTVLSETTPATANHPYAAAKRAGEDIVSGAADGGFQTISLRLGNLFGEYEKTRATRRHLSLLMRIFAEAKADGTILVETPDARRDWTYVADIGRACATLFDSPPMFNGKIVHCGSGQIFTDLELANLIAARLGNTDIVVNAKPSPKLKAPMVSGLKSCLTNLPFTPVEKALDRFLVAEVA